MPLNQRLIGLVAFVVAAHLLFVTACSDAATRAAYNIKSGVSDLGSEEGARAQISYRPRSSPWPNGCVGSYKFRINKGASIALGNNNFRTKEGSGSLTVFCMGRNFRQLSPGTTYHLRFVDVPVTVEVVKNRGETAIIELQRVSGRATVVGLH